MARQVLGFSVTTRYPAPPLRSKRKVKKVGAKKKDPRGRTPQYPYQFLEVGESFFLPSDKRSNVTAAAAAYRDRKFATRAATVRGVDGFRVWRVL